MDRIAREIIRDNYAINKEIYYKGNKFKMNIELINFKSRNIFLQ